MSTVTRTQERVEIRHENTQRFGGYVVYFKLYGQLWSKMSEYHKLLPLKHQILAYAGIIVKTPWWLGIKPLGCLFKKKVFKTGPYLKIDGVIVENNIKKLTYWYFLGIPFIVYAGHVSNEELMEKN